MTGTRGFHRLQRVLFALSLSFLVVTPANAQDQQQPASLCLVETSDTFGAGMGTARPVIAICGGRGLVLGYADDFQVSRNERLGAVLVDIRLHKDRRLLLISLQDDGEPLLEDISGQIALAAGKGPMSPLEGVDIDAAGFGRDGTLGLRGGPQDNGGIAQAGTIDLGQQIVQVRSHRRERTAQN